MMTTVAAAVSIVGSLGIAVVSVVMTARLVGREPSPRGRVTATATAVFWAAPAVVSAVMLPPRALLLLAPWLAAAPALAVTDLRARTLPDSLTLPPLAVTAVTAGWMLPDGGHPWTPLAAYAAALVAPVLATHLWKPEGLGFGDVKLVALIAVAAGSVCSMSGLSPSAAVLAGSVGLVAATAGQAVFHVVKHAAAREGGRLAVPFAPALIAGPWLSTMVAAGAF